MKRTALITGGSSGIGFAIAQKLVALGFDIIITGRKSTEEISEKLEILKKSKNEVIYIQSDASKSESRQNLIEYISQNHREISVLVNNAGVAPKIRMDILETTEESYDYVMDTNLKGQFFLSQGIANLMIKQETQSACIINISSVSATMASVNRAEYCISKAGIAMSSQLFALRLAEYGISVYEIRPGIIKTEMTKAVTEKYDKLIADGLIPQNRWGIPDDVAKVVGSIVQGDFTYSSGNVFMVDGGLSLSKL